jgi:hypothetical protein
VKVPEELLAFNRHLMVFLIAIFAFVSKTIADAPSQTLRGLYIASVIAAFASFVAGYRTMFLIFNHYAGKTKPPDETAKPPRTVLLSIHAQYILTIAALALLLAAIVLFVAIPNDSAIR